MTIFTSLKERKVDILVFFVALSSAISCTKGTFDGMCTTTCDATKISCLNAVIGGKADIQQSADVTFGVLYGTSSDVMMGASTKIQATTLDKDNGYAVTTETLEPSTTYYYRSYIALGSETEYGEVKSFKTLDVSSMIQTSDASDIYPTSAMLASFLDLTNCVYKSFVYGFTLTPDGGKAYDIKAANYSAEKKRFAAGVTDLSEATGYAVESYVTIDGKTFTGGKKSFKTCVVSITADVTDVASISAAISGKLSVNPDGSMFKSIEIYHSNTATTVAELLYGGIKTSASLSSDGSFTAGLTSLSPNTSYNYVVTAIVADSKYNSEVKSFKTKDFPRPQAVDLGLSVKWASANIGADSEENNGGYYQWAGKTDVTSSSYFLDWNYCPYHTGGSSASGWTKYNTDQSLGTVDNKTVLDSDDDVATAKLGGTWRIPTDTEWKELIDNCTWTKTTVGGVSGYKVAGKKTGYTDKSIFLPFCGKRTNDYPTGVGVTGNYWASTLRKMSTSYYPSHSNFLYMASDHFGLDTESRFVGMSIRPVCK